MLVIRFSVEQMINLPRMNNMNPYEEINNKLKLIKKKLGYGFHKFENFKLQRLLTWHFGINYQYTEQ